MRKLITAALAALTVAGGATAAATSAHAQPYGYDRHDNDRHDGRDHRGDRYDRGDRWRDDRRWDRGDSWRRHVRACSYRYRSYNPRTDMYFTGRHWRRCTL